MSVPVAIDDLHVELGGTEVLAGVGLHVRAGDFVTLLGPSGSGKTTLLNVLAGFVRHKAGRVAIGDTVVDDVPAYRRNIGFVFQSYALFPHMTVAENIAYPLVARRVRRKAQKQRVKEVLDLVHLPNLQSRPVGSLSGGQQQRVALARALVFEPSLLLLDEPLAALDKQLRDAMQLEIRRIHEQTGMTTLAVTHDQVEAMTMADRVAILNQGRVAQVGTPEEVYRRPADLFVASFLGEANLLAARDGAVPALHVATRGARDGTAIVRPEEIELTGAGEGVPARVEEVVFQGMRLRVLLRLASGPRVVCSLVGSDAATPPHPGDECVVRSRVSPVHAVSESYISHDAAGRAIPQALAATDA
jgi:putative spermidine/putrescine transport system ATP-binding protein